jgi:ACS family hexuronate transporter-like MFS transporter
MTDSGGPQLFSLLASFAKLTGYILETTGSYLPVFLIAGSAYLTALVIIHLLAPRLERAQL